MRHVIDLFIRCGKRLRLKDLGEAKEIGFNDFYSIDGHRMGTVQSFGWAPPLEYLEESSGLQPLAMARPSGAHLARRFAAAPIMAGILEDLPNADNRVTVDKGRTQSPTARSQRQGASGLLFRRALRGVLRELARKLISHR